MKRSENLINSLCDEVDRWKEEANFWKEEYEKENELRIQERNERYKQVKYDLGNVLQLAFNLKELPDGSLSISPENRKDLRESEIKEFEIIEAVLQSRDNEGE